MIKNVRIFNNSLYNRRLTIFTGFFITLLFLSGCSKLPCKLKDQMDFFEVVHARRSVRQYQSTAVPPEHITKILDAARMAPTAGNQQPWKFLVVQDQAKIQELKEACINNSMEWAQKNQKHSEEELKERSKKTSEYYDRCFSAPVYIVVLVDTKSKHAGYNHHDGPLAAGYLMLAARALGYGTVYFTDSIPEHATKEVLNIPDRYKRICITPVGVPVQWPDTPDKKPLEELVAYEEIK